MVRSWNDNWLDLLRLPDENWHMKPLLTILILAAFFCSSVLAQPVAQGRTLTQLNIIPARVLQRSVSPKFYGSLLKFLSRDGSSSGRSLPERIFPGIKVIHSELKGLFDPLALQLANEAVIAGDYTH